MGVKTKEDVLSLLEAHEQEIRAAGVRRLALFGSFVRDEQEKHSDVDLLVEFEPDRKTFDNFMHLAQFLEELLDLSVELVTPESLSPYIRPHIVKAIKYVHFAD